MDGRHYAWVVGNEVFDFESEEELNVFKNRLEVHRNQRADAVVGIADSANFGTFFGFKQFFVEGLTGAGKMIMFPVAAAASLLHAAFTWREAHLDRKPDGSMKRGNLVRAAVETVSALAITAAVIVSAVAPILFTAVSVAKTVFSLISTIYFGCKALGAKDPQEKAKFKAKTWANAINTFSGILTTVALCFISLANKATFGLVGAIAGITATGVGFVMCARQAVKTKPASPEAVYRKMQAEKREKEKHLHEQKLNKQLMVNTKMHVSLSRPCCYCPDTPSPRTPIDNSPLSPPSPPPPQQQKTIWTTADINYDEVDSSPSSSDDDVPLQRKRSF